MRANSDSSLFKSVDTTSFPRIERLVCSGGGAKGVVYPGSYKALEETGVIQGVDVFSGASAGAITVALIAVGMSSAHFRKVLLSTNLAELMGEGIGTIFGSHSAGVCFMTKDGKPLEKFLRQHIEKAVKTSLSAIEKIDQIASHYPELQGFLLKLNSMTPRITFNDLALLNRIFPNKFKQLVIPAVKFPGGELQIFNSDLTPDVEIALACRASASIPVILEPVEIDIGGQKQKFVDGGFYDNLPTDYFDKDAAGNFIKNTKPEQTMVFAFGEGFDNKKNQVFQALYGHRWDEVISEELFGSIFDESIKLALQFFNELETEEIVFADESELLMGAVECVLRQRISCAQMTVDVAQVIIKAMARSIDDILSCPKDHQAFWKEYQPEREGDERMKLLGKLGIEKMKPILTNVGLFRKFVCNVLVGVLGDLKAPYKHTVRSEAGYQKLRTEYPLRTVELRVGELKTTDFSEATKCARVMDAFGYLDTINHISHHELHDPARFNPMQFYINLVHYFKNIYQAVLQGTGKDPKMDRLIQKMEALHQQLGSMNKNEAVICRQIYQLIKDKAEESVDSIEAFALSRAVEFHNQTLNAEELFKEAYVESFRNSSAFSISEISGERFFRAQSLQVALVDKNMFELYKAKPLVAEKTRTERVFDALQNIKEFQDAFSSVKEKESLIDVP